MYEQYEALDDVQLQKRVMNLEFKLQDAMRREKNYGRGSTTNTLHSLCNELWMLVDRRQRHQTAFGSPLPKKVVRLVSARPKAPATASHPYG